MPRRGGGSLPRGGPLPPLGFKKGGGIGFAVLESGRIWPATAVPVAHHDGVFTGAPFDRIPPRGAGRHRILCPSTGATHCVAGHSISRLSTMESMAKTLAATMRALAVTPMQTGSARQVELPIPTVSRDTAVMRVLEVGIDGTDTEINAGLYGEAPPGSDFLVIGHEALSVVESVGERVSGFT